MLAAVENTSKGPQYNLQITKISPWANYTHIASLLVTMKAY